MKAMKAMKTATKTRIQRRRIAQGAYEKFMKDNSHKRPEDPMSMNDEKLLWLSPRKGW